LNRPQLLIILTITLFSMLFARVFYLQVWEHGKFKNLAKNNSTRVSLIRAPRGIIYDRNGVILVTSKQSLRIIAYPYIVSNVKDKRALARNLSKLTGKAESELFKILNETNPRVPLPIQIANNIDVSQAIKIYENAHLLPGIDVESQPIRYYPYGEVPAHLLGYVGEANEAELEYHANSPKKLKLGDKTGKSGVEKFFDEQLRGVDGERRIFVDRHGKSLNPGKEKKKLTKVPEKGNNLHLTIDIDIQRAAYDAMGDLMGAAVVVNPKNGEVLALVSKPSYNPNFFAEGIPHSIYQELSKKKAFLNRAGAGFTPGSIWKPITVLAALENKVIDPATKLHVSGAIYLGGFKFGDWTSEEGSMDMRTALAWSRDTYFYQVAKLLKPEQISSIGLLLGAGEKTGIETGDESAGIVPDPNWKKKHMGEAWYPGNTLHLSIGQSFLLVTPLQAATMISTMANYGKVPQLHVIKDKNKNQFKRVINNIKPESFKVLNEGLRQCVQSGTGGASNMYGDYAPIQIAGKTGSAEVYGYRHSTHAWFIAYAPYENPEIALALFGEGAGHGGSICAPVAQKIFEAYFKKYHPVKPEDRESIISKPFILNNKPTSAVDAETVPQKEEANDNRVSQITIKPPTGTTPSQTPTPNILSRLINKPQGSKPEFTIEESDEALSGPSPVIKDDDENKERKRRQH